jgi:hypothetical protein
MSLTELSPEQCEPLDPFAIPEGEELMELIRASGQLLIDLSFNGDDSNMAHSMLRMTQLWDKLGANALSVRIAIYTDDKDPGRMLASVSPDGLD